MVYETVTDEDVLEVIDTRGWRSVYAVTTNLPTPLSEIPVILDFDDDEVTQVRAPAPAVLAAERR